MIVDKNSMALTINRLSINGEPRKIVNDQANLRHHGETLFMRSANILLIGFGAMGRSVYQELKDHPGIARWYVLEQASRLAATQDALGERGKAVSALDQLDATIDFAVECAGHGAIRSLVPELLEKGMDTVVASVGALAGPGVWQTLEAAAIRGSSQLTLVPGALAGMDALAAARDYGLDDVEYVGRKSPRSWAGTPAASLCDLDHLQGATPFFSGTAREAATLFPQNANVAAMVGLAGMGLDQTRATLIADPAVTANTHTVKARGAFGRFEVTIENLTLAANPKTSALAGMSIVRVIRNRLNPITM